MVEILALAIYMECRGCDTYVDKVAVAHVIMNRVHDRDGEFRNRNTIYDVISQPGHFPWYGEEAEINNSIDKTSWIDVKSIARMVINGKTIDPTNGAKWFHGSHVTYSWTSDLTPVPIGSQVHTFWKQ